MNLYNKDINININTKALDNLAIKLSRMKEGVEISLKKSADMIINEANKKTQPKSKSSFHKEWGNCGCFDCRNKGHTIWSNCSCDECRNLRTAGGTEKDSYEDYQRKCDEAAFKNLTFDVWFDGIQNRKIIPINPEKDPRLPKDLYTPKRTKWVIDDLIDDDKIIVFDPKNVYWIKDKTTGKEYCIVKKKGEKFIKCYNCGNKYAIKKYDKSYKGYLGECKFCNDQWRMS